MGKAADRAQVGSSEAVTIRHFGTWADYRGCVALQQEIWGVDFGDIVSAAILKVSQRLGGVAAGAFDRQGQMIGFVFGITGVEHGRLVHWSDMLGVRAGARDQGIGRKLKDFQRNTLRPLGVSVIYWTYDPLVARNAYLNLMQLGTDVVEYVPDFYGPQTSSTLHAGLGTDRFIIAWRIDEDPRQPPSLPNLDSPTIPLINGTIPPVSTPTQVRIAIPLHIDRIQQSSLGDAARWRTETRPAFQWALAHGYKVVGFQRDDRNARGLYELRRE